MGWEKIIFWMVLILLILILYFLILILLLLLREREEEEEREEGEREGAREERGKFLLMEKDLVLNYQILCY